MNLEFVATTDFSAHQQRGLESLRAAVYPPEVMATLPSRLFTWASPRWSVLVWDGEELVSRVGLLVRNAFHDGTSKRIGGIGGVATHPASQGKGYASLAMREATKHFDKELKVDYALLFCRPHLVPFYGRLGWKPFEGKVFVEQPRGKIDFTANGAMVLDVKEEAPLKGILDLNGLPW
ncbi:MAG TPA: GNAT family N-acetyltransferase [Anaerolineales bacterium]|nr:GNAT family N-acetyltransferase [Anaerolineales bacterium]